MIYIERFSYENIEQHAADVTQLAADEAEWLERVRPQTLTNFTNERAAVLSLGRVIDSRSLSGNVLRVDKRAVGLATLVTDLCMHRPDKRFGTVTGDQIDYWTVDGLDADTHAELVRELISTAASPLVLATLSRPETERARGIPLVMEALGAPGRVRIPHGKPDYGLRAIIEPLQTYVHSNVRQPSEGSRTIPHITAQRSE